MTAFADAGLVVEARTERDTAREELARANDQIHTLQARVDELEANALPVLTPWTEDPA